MSRINRKTWNDRAMGIETQGGVAKRFGNEFKAALRISDNEYTQIAEHATDTELQLLTNKYPNFGERRQIIKILNKYIKY